MIIVLLGYMASGKSFVGKRLADTISYNFIDLDHYIEQREGLSISEIFKTKGEIYFRKLETEFLNQILDKNDNCVLALGGGTPCYAGNMNAILQNQNCKSIYLKASLSVLVERLINEKNKRPLISHLATEDALLEFVGKHLFERNNFYSLAEFTISTDNKNLRSITEDIVFKLF